MYIFMMRDKRRVSDVDVGLGTNFLIVTGAVKADAFFKWVKSLREKVKEAMPVWPFTFTLLETGRIRVYLLNFLKWPHI